ncbi:MAG: hypothetical protein GX679_02090, partial [Methanocorpusculum parvum]|nr:hypothetical protein [Methanocorpusculum parvum]
RRLEKYWGKTGVPVFLSVTFSFCVIEKIMKQQKNPHAGFSVSIFQERVRFLRRRSAGAERDGARKMRFALIRGGVQAEGLRAASNEQKLIWAYSRFVFLMLPHPTNSFQNWSHINTA